MTRQCGGQTGGFFGGLRKFCADNRPPIWKLYGNAFDVSAAQAVKDSGAFLVAREVRGDQFDPAEDIPAAVARAMRYAELVISRAGPFMGLVDAWEFYNEPVINISFSDGTPNYAASLTAARSLNAAQVAFSNKLHAAGLKVVAYNLARGNPFYGVFPELADGLAASDYGGFHAYGAPLYETDAENQSLRYRRLYASLLSNARKPIIFTEHGTDFNGGGFRLPANNLTTAQFFQSMDWWLTQLAADASFVFGAVGFVVGADSGRWQTFEIAEDDSLPLFATLCKKEYQGGSTPPPNPEPEPPSMTTAEKRSADAFNAADVRYNKDAALFKYAQAHNLGYPVTNEYDGTYDGEAWVNQGYADAIVSCRKSNFSEVFAFDWLTGLPYVPPSNGGGNPQNCPAVIGANGAVCELINPHRQFVLAGASVKQGVSAFAVVTVIGKNGVPVVGARVINIWKDSTNGEMVFTDGSGVARFQFGASSASSVPGGGPFTFAVSLDGFKDTEAQPPVLHQGTIISDLVHSVSDWNSEHTEWSIQFVEVG